MSRTRGSRADKRGRITALLATLMAPAALYLVARAAAVGISPSLAAGLPPVDPSAALSPVLSAALIPTYTPDPRLLNVAREAAVSAPTWHGAYVLAAKKAEQQRLVAKQQGRTAEQQERAREAIALLEEVRRRRPKFLPGRLLLIAQYGYVGRYSDLLNEMNFAMSYSAGARQQLLPLLIKLIADPNGRPAIAMLLARNPDWVREFYQAEEAQKLPPADVEALLRLREGSGGDVTRDRELLVASLANAGRYAEARARWLQSLPADERSRHALLFNGSFEKINAQPAFNWKFNDNELGRAEISSLAGGASALDVGYFGGRATTLAEQKTALAAGRYRLTVTAQIPNGVQSGTLIWVISCLPQGPEVARLDMTQVGTRPRVIRTAFTVPASGCGGQALRLIGEPGEIAAPIDAQVHKVGIDREG